MFQSNKIYSIGKEHIAVSQLRNCIVSRKIMFSTLNNYGEIDTKVAVQNNCILRATRTQQDPTKYITGINSVT